jgi:hypothetical protein
MKDGTDHLYTWGRRDWEYGGLPATGGARQESIKSGKWDRYHPIPVKIHIKSFMEKDGDGIAHWFRLEPYAFVQGALVSLGEEQRVYVVTREMTSHNHPRWPVIVGTGQAIEIEPDDLFARRL